jgi:hypothetical protein
MDELKSFNDDTPLRLSGIEKENVIKKINEAISCLSYFKNTIQEDITIVTNVWTCLGLNESFHADLSKMVGYDSILAKEREERHKEIREKNEKIRRLIEQRGKEVTPEAIQGALNRYEDIFRAWFKNEGFHYASIQNLSAYGLIAELTSQMDYVKPSSSNDDEICNKIWKEDVGTEDKFNNGWNIYKDQYHGELLDTDNNKQLIKELLLENFPNARIYKFSGRKNDHGSFSLCTEVYISYLDLDNYYHSLN